MFHRLSLMTALTLGPAAHAATICIVDAEVAIAQTTQGKAAQKQLETLQKAKEAELDAQRKALTADAEAYGTRQAILSKTAREAEERGLLEKQRKLEQSMMAAEQELQQTWAGLMGTMEGKVVTVVEALAKKKSCTVVLHKQAAIFAGPEVVDLTQDLVAAYNNS